MNTRLSDELKATRDALLQRGRFGLFFSPRGILKLARRVNTFVALAEDLEDELHLAELRAIRDAGLSGATVLPFPGRSLVFPTGGDAS